MKKLFAALWLTALAFIVGALFWYNELQYQLPTPVPAGYQQVSNGTSITLPAGITSNNNKPIFLHFFNPDCPCSRFNINQFKEIVKRYEQQVNFKVVVMTAKPYTANQIREKFGLTIPVTFDQRIAASCGVYSTPQVALLDGKHRLYYRGNYNRSRYCTDEQTNYARIAVNGLLERRNTQFASYALRAYGCTLPGCQN